MEKPSLDQQLIILVMKGEFAVAFERWGKGGSSKSLTPISKQ